MSGGDAPFLAPSGSLSIADGEGWGEAASLLVRSKNLPLSTGLAPALIVPNRRQSKTRAQDVDELFVRLMHIGWGKPHPYAVPGADKNPTPTPRSGCRRCRELPGPELPEEPLPRSRLPGRSA